MTKHMMRLAGILICIAIVGSALWSYFEQKVGDVDIDFVIGVTAFSIGVVTFFGMAALNPPNQDRRIFTTERLRTSIACSLMMSYLYIVSFTTFVKNSNDVGGVTKAFVASYSSVIGITIAFYFGASAAVQIFGKEKGDQPKNGDVQGK